MWLIYCAAGVRKWINLKGRLPFCKVTQDGDAERCLSLLGPPTSDRNQGLLLN